MKLPTPQELVVQYRSTPSCGICGFDDCNCFIEGAAAAYAAVEKEVTARRSREDAGYALACRDIADALRQAMEEK